MKTIQKDIFIKLTFVLSVLLWNGTNGICQSRVYISGGLSNVMVSGNWNTALGNNKAGYRHGSLDAEYERRIMSAVSLVTGVSIFNAGYSGGDLLFGSASEFRAVLVGIPLMARWNIGNRNFILVDLGLNPYYLLDAELKESAYQFNKLKVVEGNITKYSNRFYFATKIQLLYPINRFLIGMYFTLPAPGQSSIRGLDGHWGLNSQQSSYLMANGFSDFMIFGLKAGLRIK